MSLYSDILRQTGKWSYPDEDEVRKDGETWTVSMHLSSGPDYEIPGFATKEMAIAVAMVIRDAYHRGYDCSEECARYS